MTEEYEILIDEDNLQVYIESVKPLIDNALRENLSVNLDSEFAFSYKPIFAVLTLLTAEICGGKTENILNAAVSVEYINKSLQFFESNSAAAISLLNSAYGAIFETKNVSAERQILAHKELVDCLSVNKLNDLNEANLIRLAMRIGAVLSGIDYVQLAAITRFADLLENAVQTKNSDMFFNPNSFIDQAKSVLLDEFGITKQSHLLCDLADFMVEGKR